MLLKSKRVAYLGLLLALNQITIILSSFIKTNTLSLFAVASLFISIAIIEFGIKNGIVFYIASAILGYVLTMDRIEILSYIIMFGIYPICKYYIERLYCNKKTTIVFEYLTKLLVMNVLIGISYIFLKQFIKIEIQWWMLIVLQLLLLIYDYAFSTAINYYYSKIRNKLKIKK